LDRVDEMPKRSIEGVHRLAELSGGREEPRVATPLPRFAPAHPPLL
jgi:hypothetical protein